MRGGFEWRFIQRNSLRADKQFAPGLELIGKRLHGEL